MLCNVKKRAVKLSHNEKNDMLSCLKEATHEADTRIRASEPAVKSGTHSG